MVDFNNTEIAFRYRSDSELKRGKWLFEAVANPGLVSLGKKALDFAFAIKLPVEGIIKSTVFNQFCGGEDVPSCTKTIERLDAHGVKVILDYSVEGKEREEDFDRTCKQLCDIIEFSKNNTAIPFAVFKVTGLARMAILEKISSHTELITNEQSEWDKAKNRVFTICKKAFDAQLPVMIDAEESWIQGAIDQLAEEMIFTFNQHKSIVYNTLQMYRHDRLAYLGTLLEKCKENKVFLGVKIVRGAYMEKERERAAQLGYQDPIQPNKEASDRDYDAALRFVIQNITQISLVAGTHNEESCKVLLNAMTDLQMASNHPSIYYSQLFGMSDHLSFNLANAGYNVVKYLPFGPVRDVMPYLIRRAEENTSVAGQTGRELSLIKKELRRRKLA